MTECALLGPIWRNGPITRSDAYYNYPQDACDPFSSYMASHYEAVVASAFQAWAAVSGLVFQNVSDS